MNGRQILAYSALGLAVGYVVGLVVNVLTAASTVVPQGILA